MVWLLANFLKGSPVHRGMNAYISLTQSTYIYLKVYDLSKETGHQFTELMSSVFDIYSQYRLIILYR